MERERRSRSRRRVTEKDAAKTLPSSPSHHHHHSSSSSDFEFITISNNNSTSSPHHHNKPFSFSSSNLCPADELFYKGQLLPLHLSPRLSMVQTLLLSSSSTSSSSDTVTTTTSRDSNSSNDSNSSFSAADLFLLPEPDSARPSSVTEEDEFKRLKINQNYQNLNQIKKPTNKYLSLISSVFRKNRVPLVDQENSPHSVKKVSNSAKEVISKYLKKVKPLYEKLSQKQSNRMSSTSSMAATRNSGVLNQRKELNRGLSQSFSENLRYPRRKNCVSSCPSSMRSSPTRGGTGKGTGSFYNSSDSSSMEELQSAIQGAIAHCKNSMIQKKTL